MNVHGLRGVSIGRLLMGCVTGLLAAILPARGEPPVSVDVRRDATVEVIEKVNPCVVNIATTRLVERRGNPWQDMLRRFYGWRNEVSEDFSIGSGVIVDEDGYILTNFHVLENATRVQVKLWDGRVYDAEPSLVVTKQKDVALLKIRPTKPGEKFKAIKFAKDDDLLLGETVIALGNPYGLGGSVTKGILSSKNRRPTSGDEPLGTQDWLQTDADINPGNSGGPLVNLRGELIGINVALYRPAQGEDAGKGVSFAIPVKQLSSALADFFRPEVTMGWYFGARVSGLVAPLTITEVWQNSPADKAGLKVGQQIMKVNNTAPRGLAEFATLLTANSNRIVNLEVAQNGASRKVSVTMTPFEELIKQRTGLTLLALSPEVAANFGVEMGQGVFIDEIQKDSPAAAAKLERGMLLLAIDGRGVGDQNMVATTLTEKKPGDRAQLAIIVPRRFGNGYVQLQRATVSLELR